MQFALFYEIPSPAVDAQSEHSAYKDTLEQASPASSAGFHAFWTVEHHFLEEYSHCSNPEVLYGAIAARTESIRLGYGVRLMPKPYNHPVRTAESARCSTCSDGRVDFAPGRSVDALELEASASILTRRGHVAGGDRARRRVLDEDESSSRGQALVAAEAARPSRSRSSSPHPPIWGATSSDDGHRQVG
jgi:alkanesulfonate monooxygenase SsuD/methylene tetrahydromethanopterin reductase-like flavin-dependent oxidoreductase (luciferase family)